VGERDTESKVILHEHGVITREFSDAVLKCLPAADYYPSPEEIASRKDLRDRIVCSIDPPGCKDIDDALHCRKLENGNWEVGVHIADVSHYVKPDSAIDEEAQQRCTTVYLVEKRTDMLPSLLTTDLCSLVGHRDRLCFSCLWEVKPDTAEIVNVEFCKAIICSSGALTYYQAQAMHDDPNDKTELTESIRRLTIIARLMRAARNANGALELASSEVKFEMDSETHDPTDVKEYQKVEMMKVIEEFMLLGNRSVADHIAKVFPAFAVLRRHPPPKADALKKLEAVLGQQGFKEFKFGSNLELAQSLERATKPDDPYFNVLVRTLVCRCMNQAVYFPTGECDPLDFPHYGLAIDRYTHFTSPIRRYADVLVHRLLAASLGLWAVPPMFTDKERIKEQCGTINLKKRNADWSGRASVELHTYLFFEKNGSQEVDSVVIRCRKNGIQVSVPRFGIEGVAQIQQEDWNFDDDEEVLSSKDGKLKIKPFDHVWVRIEATKKDFRLKTELTFLEMTPAEKWRPAHEDAKIRQKVEAEMFPDRLDDAMAG